MKKPKLACRILTSLSLVGYAATALSVLLIPRAIDSQGRLTALGYTAGSLFWIGLIFGLVCFILAWNKARKETLYQKIKGWFGPGFLGFGRSPFALVTDILCGLSLVAVILGNTLWHYPDILMISLLIIFVTTFLWHFVLNGRVYIYAHHKRQLKTQTKKDNPLQRKESETK